jgi:2'-5' RNA ligase
METKRIFAAIDISEQARERVAAYQRSLRQEFQEIPIRWEKPEKLHITVKFVGSIDDSELEEFTSCVAHAASEIPPFLITVAETGAFVRRSSRGNVLWLGLRSESSSGETEMIEKLAANIDTGISRKLTPHLTIARLKDARKARELIQNHLNTEFEPVNFKADEITIYESTLMPTGSVYKAVSRHEFTKYH